VVVLVTETEYGRAAQVFESAPVECIATAGDEDTLAAAVVARGARYVIVGSVKYVGKLYDVLPRGGVIARFGVGHDGIDKKKATTAGLFCTNTPGVLDESVAEHAILLMLAAARRLPALSSEMRAGHWALGPAGIELRGKTLAVIGGGRIGQATARIATLGFGMRAVACRRTPTTGDTTPFEQVTTDFAATVKDADFVSLHLNAEPANHHFINRERLGLISPHAWLINTARGSVVDERALFDAVAGERLAGAALDVFDREPYVPIEPSRDLRTLPNVVLVPHVGSHTAEANKGMAERALQNVMLAEAGDYKRMDVVNPEVFSSTNA
jgi:lactate dehydrogenase-like 2-hydroxyacid dehydrogenase